MNRQHTTRQIYKQHNIFFEIRNSLQDLIPRRKYFWPEAKAKLYIDAGRVVGIVADFSIKIIAKPESENSVSDKLFPLVFLYKKSTRKNGCF
jgi:hypothetical protein